MALWTADIEKILQGEYWTNRYIIEAASLAAAQNIAGPIYGFERAITDSRVTFTKLRIADLDPTTDVFRIIPLGVDGLRINLTTLLPLFNVVRVDFSVADGRPSRKYLRGILCEADVAFTDIVSTTVGLVESAYAVGVAAVDGYVDVDGQPIIGQVVSPFVGMRQLRRGSRRRQTPIL